MEDKLLKELWKSTNEKLEENLIINKKNMEEITQMKVVSLVRSMKPIKIFTLIVGFLWVVFVDAVIINLFDIANPFFLISAGIQVLLTKLAIGIYLYQLILIHRIDISKPILATQEKLAGLKSSTLWVTRILFLQLPVWQTFYWNASMLESGNTVFYIIHAAITLVFIFLAVWLFINIKYENKDKKWFRFIFNDKEWKPILKSIALYKEIESFK